MNNIFNRLPLSLRILFIKQLAMLIRAGVPLLSALLLLQSQTKSKIMRLILDGVIGDIQNGQTLSSALAKHPIFFSKLAVHIISVGELSGTLSQNLDYLAVAMKKSQALRQKLISASVYPLFIIVATIGMTFALALVIFPKIIPVFKSVHYQLPWTTRFLIFFDTAVQHYWLVMLLVTGFFITGFLWLLKLPKVRRVYEITLLKLPIINSFIQTYHTASITRTLGTLLASNVTVVDAFTISSRANGHLLYQQQLKKIAGQVVKGQAISASINQGRALFPAMVAQIIAVGESTGRLGETFLYLAEMYEDQMDDMTKNLSTLIEPLLLIFMGLLVGFVAISIITPIYGITQHLNVR